MISKRVKRGTICLVVTAMVGVFLTSCGEKISVVEAGKAYNINETCKVLETYEQYNLQVPVEQMAKELMEAGFQDLTFKAHTVQSADKDTSESGKYDVVDTIDIIAEGADPFEILPQTMEIEVEYKRDAATLEWTETNKVCKKWKINHKKLGGTAWKMSTADGDTYIRLRDTIEFFYVKVNQNEKAADFDTTILGAMAIVKDNKITVQRIHILSGTVLANGTIILNVQVYDEEVEDYKEEAMEVVLNDFERIEKAELPFSEEEYKGVAAW